MKKQIQVCGALLLVLGFVSSAIGASVLFNGKGEIIIEATNYDTDMVEISKISGSNGNVIWSNALEGYSTEWYFESKISVKFDKKSDIYGVYLDEETGDPIIFKLSNSTGNVVWRGDTYEDGNLYEILSLEIDKNGNVLVNGIDYDDNPTVMKYSTTGELVWKKVLIDLY